MKVQVDADLCESNSKCVEACPEVFLVNEQDELVILEENPPEALRAKLEEAVERCPRQAISVG